MATQSTQPPLIQLPDLHCPHNQQQRYGYNIQFGGHSYDPGLMNPPTSTIDPYTRIGVLEKELEHCQTGKAEAEIAVQYLVTLNAKGAANGFHQDEQITKLMQQLAQAEKDKEASDAKLENALAIITSILTSKIINPVSNSASTSDKFRSGPASGVSVQKEDLIDLAGASKGFGGSSTSGNDATLLDQSYGGSSEDKVEAQEIGQAKHSLVPELTDAENEPYIHHFLPNAHDFLIHGVEVAKRAFQVPTPDARRLAHPGKPSSSPDQRSETSVEPDTDVSSHDNRMSSDGPSSSLTSFVSATSQVNDAPISPTEFVAKKAGEAQALGVQKWNVAASATSFTDAEASGSALSFQEKMWSSKNRKISPVAKSSHGPFLEIPSWQVCNLFSSRSQREDTIPFHKTKIGPDERDSVPDLLKYGVRFKPDPSERNIYRTVLVQGLSSDTTVHQLLQNVRGGKVIDAKLLETRKLVGSNSALIVFLHERATMAYEEYARIHSLTINNQLVNVKVVNSPTYPTRISLQKAIEDLHYTRCLEVHKFPRHVSECQLQYDLRMGGHMNGDGVEHLKMRRDNILELHFSSIDYAGRGFGVLTTNKLYKGCKAWFVPDPCAQPLETLLRKTCEIEAKVACLELENSAIEEFNRLAKIKCESAPWVHPGLGLEKGN